jgi:hypothetical protein
MESAVITRRNHNGSAENETTGICLTILPASRRSHDVLVADMVACSKDGIAKGPETQSSSTRMWLRGVDCGIARGICSQASSATLSRRFLASA